MDRCRRRADRDFGNTLSSCGSKESDGPSQETGPGGQWQFWGEPLGRVLMGKSRDNLGLVVGTQVQF